MASNLRVTELDFFQIKNNLKTYLKSLQDSGKFKDYDFDGSGMSVLLDILAYNTHYNAINANMAINEVFLDTAERRNNVVSHAKMLGYIPHSVQAPWATINVVVNMPDSLAVQNYPTTLTMARGTRFSTTLNNKQYTFSTLESTTISPINVSDTNNVTNKKYLFEGVKIYEGVIKSWQYTVDSFDTSQYFQIPDVNADITTLIVKVRANSAATAVDVYSLASNFTDLTYETPAYFIQEGVDGKYEIYFGDGNIGKKLGPGNVIDIEWLSTNGAIANGSAGFKMTDTIEGYTDVNITSVARAIGGGDREDIASIKFNAPLSYLAQNRVVTADDYKTIIANNYANVETLTVWGGEENDPPAYGKVYISIKPKDSDALPDAEKQFIVDQILRKKNIVSITPEIVDPTYTYLYLHTYFKYNPNLTDKTAGELKSEVATTINTFNNNELKVFDGVYRHSKLLRAIDSTDASILNSTALVYMQKRIIPTLNIPTVYEFAFSAAVYQGETNSQTLSSSGFTYNGITQYIEAVPMSVTTALMTHRLQMYTISLNQKLITNTNIGYMNALTGKVTLQNFAPSAFEGEYISFTALPNSNDVAPRRNELLAIDMQLVQITPQVDTIVTGGSNAGIGYVTTPRHES